MLSTDRAERWGAACVFLWLLCKCLEVRGKTLGGKGNQTLNTVTTLSLLATERLVPSLAFQTRRPTAFLAAPLSLTVQVPPIRRLGRGPFAAV